MTSGACFPGGVGLSHYLRSAGTESVPVPLGIPPCCRGHPQGGHQRLLLPHRLAAEKRQLQDGQEPAGGLPVCPACLHAYLAALLMGRLASPARRSPPRRVASSRLPPAPPAPPPDGAHPPQQRAERDDAALAGLPRAGCAALRSLLRALCTLRPLRALLLVVPTSPEPTAPSASPTAPLLSLSLLLAVLTTKEYMRIVSEIKPEWLVRWGRGRGREGLARGRLRLSRARRARRRRAAPDVFRPPLCCPRSSLLSPP